MTLEEFFTKATLWGMKLDILPDIKTGWCEIHTLLEFPMMLYQVSSSRKVLP